MRIALVLASLSVVSLAAAQASGLPNFSAPMVLRGGLDRRTENACSRSHAHGTSQLRSVLRVARDGAVELEITADSRSFMGPSRARFSMGDRETSELGHALHAVLRGHATLGPDAMRIDFVEADLETAYWSGPGTLPLGPLVTHPFVASLTCDRVTRPVLPAGPAVDGEVPSDRAIAECTWSSVPSELAWYGDTRLYFGAGDGVIEHDERSLFDRGADPSSLRVADPPTP